MPENSITRWIWLVFIFRFAHQSAEGLPNNSVGAKNVLEYLLKTVTNSDLLVASLWCCCTTKEKQLDISIYSTHFVPLLGKSVEEIKSIFAAIPPGEPKDVIASLSASMVRRTPSFSPLSDSPIGQKRKIDSTDFAEHKESKEEETDLDQEGSLNRH